MCSLKTRAWLLALLGLALTGPEGTAAPLPREILGGELIVKNALEALEAPVGRIEYLADADLARAFPDYLFYVVSYAPAAAASLPAPLKAANVFAVDPDGRALLLAGPPEFVALFKAGFYPPRRVEKCRFAVRAALLLVRAEYPGYKLRLAEDEIKITTDARGVKQGFGQLVLTDGGPGGVSVTVTLDGCCDPTRFVFAVNLKALKVFDPRVTAAQIAAAAKLVKVRVAEARLPVVEVKYLEDPVLRRAAPGYLFFVVPAADPNREDPKRKVHYNVMVVGPDGQVLELFGKGGKFASWIGATLGPSRDDPSIRANAEVARRLLVATQPGFQFGAPEAPVITNVGGGLRRVVLRTPATGPGGAPWILQISYTFGRGGRIIASGVLFRPVKR